MQNTNEPLKLFLNHPRMAAEWEPVIGVLVAYPLNIPHTLMIAFAKNHQIYIMVSSEASKKLAMKDLLSWKIDLESVSFIIAPHGSDMSWVRDWGPHAIFDENRKFKLADPLYLHRTPHSTVSGKDPLLKAKFRNLFLKLLGRKINFDNEAPKEIGKYFNQEILSLPFALTGGNIFADGHSNAMSMEVLFNENRRFHNVEKDDFFDFLSDHLGLTNYSVLPNFENYGIQHIDCFLKMLDEERLLVLRPPKDHPYRQRYQEIIDQELSPMKTSFGRSYEILYMDTARFRKDELAAYVNAIILNKHIYIPFYGIPQDQIAQNQWQEAMPGYIVQGFEYDLKKETAHIKKYKDIGWRAGDALHCRTRGVWDPDMLYLSVKRIQEDENNQDEYPVQVLIVDYSQKGFKKNKLNVFWRKIGEQKWEKEILKQIDDTDTFSATIKPKQTNCEIEYYVQAASLSGKTETMPRTAPEGLYSFTTN